MTGLPGNVVNGVCKVVATEVGKTDLGKCIKCTPEETPPVQGNDIWDNLNENMNSKLKSK